MNNSILKSLQILGFSEKESRVYLALLSIKKAGALEIAKQAKIKRPTVYHILESLQTKKLVSPTLYRGVTDYRALPVEHLKSYIRQQQKELNKYLPAIEKEYDKRAQKLRLRVYDNINSLKTLLEKSLREKSAAYFIGDKKLIAEYLGDYWNFYLKRAGQLNITPKWKHRDDKITLLLWSDKVAFAKLDDNFQLFAFKNAGLNEIYKKLWKNY